MTATLAPPAPLPVQDPFWSLEVRALLGGRGSSPPDGPAPAPARDLRGLLPHLSPRSLPEGQALEPESSGAGVWLVVRGRLGITCAEGRPRLVGLLLPGELACVEAVGERSAVALTPALLAGLPPAGWLAGTEQSATLLRVLARLAADSRRQSRLRAAQVRGPLSARLARALLDLAERCGTPDRGGLLVAHGLRQEQLGELVGICRESVNKALGELSRGGALDVLPRAVLVRSLDLLQESADGARRGDPARVSGSMWETTSAPARTSRGGSPR